MPASSRVGRPFIVLIAMISTACGGQVVSPSASNASSAPSASTVTSSAGSAPIAPSARSTAQPAAVGSASAASLKGQIVFEDAGQNFKLSQIWIENADGSNVHKIVADEFTDAAASLSPDGRSILFYRFAPGPVDAPGVMLVVNVDGTGLREVIVGDQARGCDDGPEGDAWSPDGSRIVYVRYCFDRAGQFVQSGIWTIRPDGTDPRMVTRHVPGAQLEDHRVGWAPDGKILTFERIDTSVSPERAAIFTIGIDGKNLRQVTPWSLDANDPDWSPDGSLIAFNASAEPSPMQNIYTIHPDGSALRQLTTYDEVGQATFHPSWSPDGAHILFSHSPSTDGWGDFYVMDRDGEHQSVIAHTALHENHGTWGPSVAP